MQSQSRLLEDLARVASSAMGVASGMREEVETRLREQFERVLARMDLVTREEFEAVRAMAVKAREEQEAMTARLAVLEAALAAKAETPASNAPARKAPAQKASAGKATAKKAPSEKAAKTSPGGPNDTP